MTENHNYATPEKGTVDWHNPLNDNFTKLDTHVEVRDDESNRDQYVPKQGAKFLATDTGKAFVGDGNQWIHIPNTGPHGHGGSGDGGGAAEWFNVRNFGAAGDGTSDDLAPIRQALSAASNGGTIYFPAGTYVLGDPGEDEHYLDLPDAEVALVGDGPGASTITIEGVNHRTRNIIRTAEGPTGYNWFSGFAIDGNRANVPDNSKTSGILFRRPSMASNLAIYNTHEDCMETFGGSSPDENGGGQTTIANCRFHNCKETAIEVERPWVNVTNVIATECSDFMNVNTVDGGTFPRVGKCVNVSNVISRGMRTVDFTTRDAIDVNLSNFVFENCPEKSINIQDPVNSGSQNLNIKNGVVRGAGRWGVDIGGGDNINFENVTVDGGNVGFHISGGRNVTVRDCTARNVSNGIYVTGSDGNMRVIDNSVAGGISGSEYIDHDVRNMTV